MNAKVSNLFKEQILVYAYIEPNSTFFKKRGRQKIIYLLIQILLFRFLG